MHRPHRCPIAKKGRSQDDGEIYLPEVLIDLPPAVALAMNGRRFCYNRPSPLLATIGSPFCYDRPPPLLATIGRPLGNDQPMTLLHTSTFSATNGRWRLCKPSTASLSDADPATTVLQSTMTLLGMATTFYKQGWWCFFKEQCQ
jgi:hypothetical protein